jgi:RNA polymerase sigma-54 factor
MALSPKLMMRQSQSLVMTPQLLQSIRLLQMTHLELAKFVEEEMEKNPLLERGDVEPPSRESLPTDSMPRIEASHSEAVGNEPDWVHDGNAINSESMAETFDTPLDNLFPDDTGSHEHLAPDLTAQWKSAPGSSGGSDGEGFDLDDFAASAKTLREHVREQISMTFTHPAERVIAWELADCLDENGYVNAELLEIGDRLGALPETMDSVLARLQGFDPAGIFGRDLAECLAIQLKVKDRLDPAMQALLDNLKLLAARDFVQLRRICGVDQADLTDMFAEIRALDPKPGTAFAAGVADSIIPDVIVRASPDGSWLVELNPAALPKVLVNQSYYKRVAASAQKAEDKEFMADCLQSANWLTRSLDQRARTILKVAEEIVRRQDGFLLHGVAHLKPFNLKMIAEAIKMHESTVSRVTANKYMLTPRGVFDLRYFFTQSIADTEGGDSHSASAVRHQIQKMIESESSDNVLSDDQIVEALKASGVELARRTVAKYRESMNIQSSVQRRRERRALEETGSS